MSSNDDDRQFVRNPSKLEVRITSEVGGAVYGTVRDVSVAGLFVGCTDRLPVGTLCELSVEADSEDGPITVEATGRVAHVEMDGMGIEITDVTRGHYEELRRLAGHEEPSG